MKKKTILGVVIAVVGIAMILTSFYIKSQVSEGRQQIAEAQGKLKRSIRGRLAFKTAANNGFCFETEYL